MPNRATPPSVLIAAFMADPAAGTLRRAIQPGGSISLENVEGVAACGSGIGRGRP